MSSFTERVSYMQTQRPRKHVIDHVCCLARCWAEYSNCQSMRCAVLPVYSVTLFHWPSRVDPGGPCRIMAIDCASNNNAVTYRLNKLQSQLKHLKVHGHPLCTNWLLHGNARTAVLLLMFIRGRFFLSQVYCCSNFISCTCYVLNALYVMSLRKHGIAYPMAVLMLLMLCWSVFYRILILPELDYKNDIIKKLLRV